MFYRLEVVTRYRDPQLQVGKIYIYFEQFEYKYMLILQI